jgi:hypothetical protein
MSATVMQSKYVDTPVVRWCQTLAVPTGSFTTYNTGVAGSVVKRNDIPCISRTQILEVKFFSKVRFFMRKS